MKLAVVRLNQMCSNSTYSNVHRGKGFRIPVFSNVKPSIWASISRRFEKNVSSSPQGFPGSWRMNFQTLKIKVTYRRISEDWTLDYTAVKTTKLSGKYYSGNEVVWTRRYIITVVFSMLFKSTQSTIYRIIILPVLWYGRKTWSLVRTVHKIRYLTVQVRM
jgi:hypothetical protein